MNRPTTRLEFFLLGILTGIIGMFTASLLRRDLPLAPVAPIEIPVTVRPMPQVSPAPPITELATIKICTASGMRARSRCPITREVHVAENWSTLALCPLHARVCPVDGKLFPTYDANGELLYCPDHGTKLVEVP